MPYFVEGDDVVEYFFLVAWQFLDLTSSWCAWPLCALLVLLGVDRDVNGPWRLLALSAATPQFPFRSCRALCILSGSIKGEFKVLSSPPPSSFSRP